MLRSKLGGVLLVAGICLLPQALSGGRLGHPAPWLAFAAGCLIILTQPPISTKEMLTDSFDRLSALGIYAGMIGATLAGSISFALRRQTWPAALSPLLWSGAAVAAA